MSSPAISSPDASDTPGAILGWSAKFGRRQLLALLGFFAAFLVADRLAAHALTMVLLKSKFRYSEMYRGGRSDDVVILGNSRGVNGFFAPDFQRELGVKALNLSFNGLSMEMSELLLRDYLERNQPPKLLLLEVTNLFNTGLNGDVLQLYATRSERLAAAWGEKEPVLATIHRTVAASHRFSGEFFLRVLFYLKQSDQDWINRYKVDPGFAERFRPTEAMQRQWAAPIAPERAEAMKRILELCRERGVAVRLVVTPYMPNYVRHLEGYDNWLASVAAAAEAPVVDWSRRLDHWEHFADPLHMNLEGFRVLLPQVREEIESWLNQATASAAPPR